ncbi:unnamed protein product [Lota lota]
MVTLCQRVTPAVEFPPSTKDRLKGKLGDSEAHVQLAEERSHELVGKLADMMERRYCMEEESDARRNKVSKLEAQCQEASQEKERNAQLTAKVQELETKRGSVTEPKVNALQKKVENLQEQLRDKEKQVGRLKERVKSLQVDTSNKDTALATLEESLAEKERIIERMKELIRELEDTRISQEEILAQAKETENRLEARIAQLEEEQCKTELVNDHLQRAMLQTDQMSVELTAERSTSQRLEGVRAQMECQNKELKLKLQVLEGTVKSKYKASMEAKSAPREEQLDMETRERQAASKLCSVKKQASPIAMETEKRLRKDPTRTKVLDHLETLKRENKDLQVQLERETTRWGRPTPS